MSERQKVLIVDDEPDILEMVGLLLESEGYEALTAPGGAEALALLAERAVDLVLLDIMMPEMDGQELLRRLRADDAQRGLQVLMLTAKNDIGAIARSLDGGADGFVAKPFDLDGLLELVALRLRGGPAPFYRSERSPPVPAGEDGGADLAEHERVFFLHLTEPDEDHSVITEACDDCHHRLLSIWQEPRAEGLVRTTTLVRVESPAILGRLLNRVLQRPGVRVQDCSVYRHLADIPADIMQGGRS
jgi:DNA-binding response OmpR family regulator